MTTPQQERPPKPVALSVIPENIPALLKLLPQWITWRYVWDGERQEWTTLLFNPRTGRAADSTKPRSWVPFEEVLAAHCRGGWDGIGFIHLPNNRLTGIDLDKCRDPASGDLTPEAAAVVTTMASYAEISPSGTGIRIYARG